MQLGKFKKNWSQAVRENAHKNIIIIALACTNAIAVLGWFRTEQTIVLVPPLKDETLSVSTSKASVGYKKAWALTVAELAGNVTPGNADLVLKSMGDLMAPEAYRQIAAQLATQIGEIKRDSLTMSFEPRQIMHEPATDRVFITGQFSSQGVSGTPKTTIRTYEMRVAIRLGRPWITSFKPYQGMPATEDSPQRVATASARTDGN